MAFVKGHQSVAISLGYGLAGQKNLGARSLLASVNGITIGTVIIQWSDEEIWGKLPANAGYIHQIAIRWNFAGQGLGSELLRWAERHIASEGKQFARLDCWSENPKLCAYYENAGYVFQRTVTTKYGWSLNLYKRTSDVGKRKQGGPPSL